MASICKAADGWLTDYSYRRIFYWQSNIDNAQDVFTVDYILNQTQPDMEDLRVTLNDGETLLPIWNQTTVNMDYCVLWCLFPVANTTYYLYWGNPTAEAVWNQTAVFVDVIENVTGAWLMNENLASDTVIDYSGNGNNGEPTGTTIVAGAFEGLNAREFDGVDNVIAENFTYIGGDFSELLMFKLTDVLADNYIFVRSMDGVLTQHEAYHPSWGPGNFYHVFYTDGAEQGSFKAVAADTWYIKIATYDLSEDTLLFYTNSNTAETVKDTTGLTMRNFTEQFIGAGSDVGVNSFKGVIQMYYRFNSTLDTNQIDNIIDNFSDPTLEESKILVREWNTGTILMWGDTETYMETPDVSNDELLGLIIVFFVVAVAVAAALVLSVRRK